VSTLHAPSTNASKDESLTPVAAWCSSSRVLESSAWTRCWEVDVLAWWAQALGMKWREWVNDFTCLAEMDLERGEVALHGIPLLNNGRKAGSHLLLSAARLRPSRH
jgi:hypothetical protein